jgi:hypothetical protein
LVFFNWVDFIMLDEYSTPLFKSWFRVLGKFFLKGVSIIQTTLYITGETTIIKGGIKNDRMDQV